MRPRMSLIRMVVILGGALVVMLAVVALRAETTRLHFEISELDQRAAGLMREIGEKELELARLRNPARIRAKAEELRLQGLAAPQP